MTARPFAQVDVFGARPLAGNPVAVVLDAGGVPAVQPGRVVSVRFAGDGSERKLMADYAPIKKR